MLIGDVLGRFLAWRVERPRMDVFVFAAALDFGLKEGR